MEILVRKFNKTTDTNDFNENSFETLITMKGIPPGMSRNEFFFQLMPMIDEYMIQLKQNNIFIAENKQSQYLGHIWFSLTEELNPWEFDDYFWLHNITIHPNFRNMGIGSHLMQFLEQFVQNQHEIQHIIGLHVDAKNLNALKLYQKLDYSTIITQLSYSIGNNPITYQKTNEIVAVNTDREYELVLDIASSFHENKIPQDIVSPEIRYKMDNLLSKAKTNKQFEIFLIINAGNEPLGYFTLYEAEMKYQKTAYIKHFGFNPKFTNDDAIESMLYFVENWAKMRNIEILETIVHTSDRNVLLFLKRKGFKEFGYFKQKNLG